MADVLTFKIGPLIGAQLLDIAQTNISNGNVEYGANVYKEAFHGFTDELTIKVLKNKMVVLTDEDGMGIHLSDDYVELENNEHNILDWEFIINGRKRNLNGLLKSINETENIFTKYYSGNIRDYNMLEMMKRYYNDEEMKVMSGKANIAARICGHPECKICDKGSSNPWSIWTRLEGEVETYLNDVKIGNEIKYNIPAKWEIVLYLTVRYNKLIRMLHKEYINFENTYLFLVEHDFIKKPPFIERTIENVMATLVKFCNTSEGYYHPLCDEGLYNYKETLYEDILKTKFGNEFAKYKIIKKDIMAGYDAGWLSPEGNFYGGIGSTSAMIHANIAEQITGDWLHGEEKLTEKSWIKIHHSEVYGYFKWSKDDTDNTKLFCPTPIQIKMICDYADKFHNGKIYTHPQIVKATEPVSTYKLRQMDEFKLHELFMV